MKARVLFLVLSIIISITLCAQNQSQELLEVKVTPPQFTGNENFIQKEEVLKTNSINKFIADRIEFPTGGDYVPEGSSVIGFKISETGKLTDFVVINSLSKKMDEQIIDIIRKTDGMWIPGYNNGTPVEMEKEVSFEIRTSETERVALKRDFTNKATYYFNKGTDHFLVKGNAKRALKNYDLGIRYKPYDKSLLYIRGLCRYELGYIEGAREDWQRLKELGGHSIDEHFVAEYNVKGLNGYCELSTVFLAEKE